MAFALPAIIVQPVQVKMMRLFVHKDTTASKIALTRPFVQVVLSVVRLETLTRVFANLVPAGSIVNQDRLKVFPAMQVMFVPEAPVFPIQMTHPWAIPVLLDFSALQEQHWKYHARQQLIKSYLGWRHATRVHQNITVLKQT